MRSVALKMGTRRTSYQGCCISIDQGGKRLETSYKVRTEILYRTTFSTIHNNCSFGMSGFQYRVAVSGGLGGRGFHGQGRTGTRNAPVAVHRAR